MNKRSIRQKSTSFSDLVTTKSLEEVAITEMWLKAKETSAALADITPQGYNLIHEPRRGKQGGGVEIMTNNQFDVSRCKIPMYISIESVGCTISAPLFSAHVVCIYRLIEYPLFFLTILKSARKPFIHPRRIGNFRRFQFAFIHFITSYRNVHIYLNLFRTSSARQFPYSHPQPLVGSVHHLIS